MIEKEWVIAGAVCAMVGVALGAFGAHGLSGWVAPDLLIIWETGARYQMYHAFGMFVVAIVAGQWPQSPASMAGWAFLAGVVLFSGSLYLMALTGIRLFGAITPLEVWPSSADGPPSGGQHGALPETRTHSHCTAAR